MCEISVIVPVYNAANFIERCYNSLLEQTFKDFEIIFVDDGSTDNSLELLNQIKNKDKKVKVIHQENKKQGGARNTGVGAAGGKYIAYIDIDDFVSNDFLSGLYQEAEKNNSDIAVSSILRYKNKNKQKWLLKYDSKKIYYDKKEKMDAAYGNGSGSGVWNKLYRRDFLLKKNIRFKENVYYEDLEYAAKAVFLANCIATTNVGNYFYCVNKNSTMRVSPDKKKQKDKYEGAKITALFLLKNGILNKPQTVVKYDYKFFNLNILRIRETLSLNDACEKFYLFNFIKIFQRKYKTADA